MLTTPDLYTLDFYSYSGMSIEILKGKREEVRKAAAKLLSRRRKQDYPVWSRDKGTRWEIGEPEDCILIPDGCGILKINHAYEETEDFDDEDYYDEDYYEED